MKNSLLSDIAAGKYKVGDQFPTLDELNSRHGARGPSSGSRAYADLADLGLVERRHGVGYFLRALSPLFTSNSTQSVIERLDSIERCLTDALSAVQSLRSVYNTTEPRIGDWWVVRSKVDDKSYKVVLVPPSDCEKPVWFVGLDNTGLCRCTDHFELIWPLPEIPPWRPKEVDETRQPAPTHNNNNGLEAVLRKGKDTASSQLPQISERPITLLGGYGTSPEFGQSANQTRGRPVTNQAFRARQILNHTETHSIVRTITTKDNPICTALTTNDCQVLNT